MTLDLFDVPITATTESGAEVMIVGLVIVREVAELFLHAVCVEADGELRIRPASHFRVNWRYEDGAWVYIGEEEDDSFPE